MDVGFGALGNVEVEHVADIRDVEPTGGNVGRDQDIGLASPESAHHAVALDLRQVTMQRLDGKATSHQRLAKLVHTVLGAAEDHRRGRDLGIEDACQGVDFPLARNFVV